MSDTATLPAADAALLAGVLTTLEALEQAGRRLHPPDLPGLVDGLRGFAGPLRHRLGRLEADEGQRREDAPWRPSLRTAAEEVCSALDGLASAAHDRNAFINAYRAMRASTRAVEALYPLAPSLPQVSRFFVDPPLRDDPQLAARLSEAAANPAQGAGVSHIDNARDARGGYSLYVPEYHDAGRRWPLIVALHGGSGHGADFLWTWLRDARSRGAIVLSPTSRDRTWSLMGPDIDSPRLEALVRQLSERWNVDERRVLLTGMSDGGTFAYISGLRPGSPITHLAPSSASFHPMLLDGPARARLVGLPVYLMHGVRDWMFPVDIARLAAAALSRAGSQVVYRELDDLSHTYPRDENPRILDWFLG